MDVVGVIIRDQYLLIFRVYTLLFLLSGLYGEYHRFMQVLRLDGERFRRYFRMSLAATFDCLLSLVADKVAKT